MQYPTYFGILLLTLSTTLSASAASIAPELLRPLPGQPHLLEDPLHVTLRLDQEVTEKTVAPLRDLGIEPQRLPSGQLAAVGTVLSAFVPSSVLPKLATNKSIVRIEPAKFMMRQRPLDVTAAQLQAPKVWAAVGTAMDGSMGEGITVADLEGSWDIFHPDFFRPDGSLITTFDSDADERIGAGDLIDLDEDGSADASLSILESGLSSGFQLTEDWFYVDTNANGRRDFGSAFTEETPALGEPIFVADDINQDGILQPTEKLIQLSSPKVRAVYFDGHLYERDKDLAHYPRQTILDTPYTDMAHGTGAAGIVAAGWPAYRRITGIAPAVDLVLLPSWGEVVFSIAQAQELGVNVMFHEWNDWHNFQDGTSNVEVALSESTGLGMLQVAPAGNLAGASHVMEILDLNEDTTVARLSTDGLGWYTYNAAWITFTWVGSVDDVQISVPEEDGSLHMFDPREGSFSAGGLNYWAQYDQSSRDTVKLQVVFDAGESALPTIELPFQITTTTNVKRIRGLVSDDQSGWGQGMSWLDYISDHGTALSPSTADSIIAVAAYGGTQDWGEFGAPGERRGYSGMGPRPDSERVIDIASPDDPISLACHDGNYAVYGRFGGTSGATPHVAGAVALLLGTGQFQTQEEVEEAIKAAALEDSQTGSTPNEAVGYGKIRLAPILGLPAGENLPPTLTTEVTWDSTCEQATLVATVTDPDGDATQAMTYWDMGYNGRESTTPSSSFALPAAAKLYTVIVRVKDEAGAQLRERLDVDLSSSDCTPVVPKDEGCACQSSSPIPWLLCILAVLTRRRHKTRLA